MTSFVFQPMVAPEGGDLVIFVQDDLTLAPDIAAMWPGLEALVRRAAATERFKAKAATVMTLTVPAGLDGIDRLCVVGLGPASEIAKVDWRAVGGLIAGRSTGRQVSVMGAVPALPDAAASLAELALGARLRLYAFDRYKTKKKDPEPEADATHVVVCTQDPDGLTRADAALVGLAEGVNLARDLVNEPPNVLFPLEFARRTEALRALGVEVEILGEDRLREIGMRALVAVGEGSPHDSCVALMQWRGGPPDQPPLAFVGKGVCFDSGGISIKPAGGMEDMKGDMAGAAAVVGLMHALASRKVPLNVLGAIGLTENMPDGKAQRPGDIITTLSGQTVEMINSDAEGRLVLGDVLWYVNDRFKPRFMVDLATLTGAVLVALGNQHAGLFSNDQDLADRLLKAGIETGEKVWRLPLTPDYDKLIDSKVADMKNTGGRHGGSITAAQFLQRYVKDTPWAHLDIAGTGMNAPQTEINRNWSSGWGVRLLDRLVKGYEQ